VRSHLLLSLTLLAGCGSSSNEGPPPGTISPDGGPLPPDTTRTRTAKQLADIEEPDSIAVDSDTVYAVSPLAGVIHAIPKAGGAARQLVKVKGSLHGGWCHKIATDGAFVYYMDSLVGVPNYAVWKVAKGGGDPVLVGGSVDHASRCIAYEAGFVYFTNGSIFRIPAAGGTQEVVVGDTAEADSLAVAGGHICYVKKSQAVVVVPVTGGTPHVLGGELGNTDTVAANNAFCFAGNNKVERFAIEGGARQVLATSQAVHGLVADEGGVYWAARPSGKSAIMMVAAGSDLPIELTQSTGVQDVAADATHVFFTSESESAVRSVEK
jgi:hypothetical protein